MNWVTNVLAPSFTALVTGGVLYGLVFFRQTKRQMEAGTEEKRATATDVLTGAALEMVNSALAQAASARSRAEAAEARATSAEDRAIRAERSAFDCAQEAAALSQHLERYREFVVARGLAPVD